MSFGAAPVAWVEPWLPIVDAGVDHPLSLELGRETGAGHVLHGVRARPIGQRRDCDDVLFELLDGSGRVAVVHLTFAGNPERDACWPWTEVFTDFAEFVRARMLPDASGSE